MDIGIETIRRIMGKATSRQITAKATFLVAQKAEEFIIEITQRTEALLEQRNMERVANHMPAKSKITDELILEILKGDL